MDTETVQSPLPFATDVVRRFRDCAQELAKEPGIKAFCSPLAAGLADVQKYLEDAWDAGKSDGSSERRVLKLLDNLEILCQVRSASRYYSRPATV
ncbi:hypothetical protein NKR23_g4700 [Pleurostoma richardsiae]|uniref:Uncharacterized protein n=1 Tax=Pleurostoma richardsiae TaxID=41990 RepID=A0AA38RRE2_9PEZI|nr:hypothetical protein NKR23_g4700 [Pleurostoma richardsiae]